MFLHTEHVLAEQPSKVRLKINNSGAPTYEKINELLVSHADKVAGGLNLQKSSIVEIPSAYVRFKTTSSGKASKDVDSVQTMLAWMQAERNPSHSSEFGKMHTEIDDQGKEHFYFPVKVVKEAPGSVVLSDPNAVVYVPIEVLQQTTPLQFNVTQTTPALTEDQMQKKETDADADGDGDGDGDGDDSENSADPHNGVDTKKKQQTEAGECLDGSCGHPGQLSDLAKRLEAATQAGSKAKSKRTEITTTTAKIKKTFEQTCCGSKTKLQTMQLSGSNCYKKFLMKLKKNEENNIPQMPPGLLYGMMAQESMGQCNLSGDSGNSTGLFQIYKPETLKPPKTKAQMKDAILNLDEAIKNLDEKRRVCIRKLKKDCGVDFESEFSASDQWRIVVASYNGGINYVSQACKNAKAYQTKNPEIKKVTSWNVLRLFALQNYLIAKQEGTERQSKINGRLSNVKHVDIILGKEGDQLWISDLWATILQSS